MDNLVARAKKEGNDTSESSQIRFFVRALQDGYQQFMMPPPKTLRKMVARATGIERAWAQKKAPSPISATPHAPYVAASLQEAPKTPPSAFAKKKGGGGKVGFVQRQP